MTLSIPFDNSYARLPASLFTRQSPQPVTAPELLAFNRALAADLGITEGDNAEMGRVFGGNAVPAGADPLAQLYAGHQFGNWNPQLGDGRAVLLGEVVAGGNRYDIQLKGSGRTPYSRGGDGRAWLGPVLREFVVSEAMHALGVPTTRALAAVATGDTIWRDDGPLPGAVLTRVAASHIRVGTFQVLAARGMTAELQALYDHVVDRHYPDVTSPAGLLDAVIARQAELIPHWMSVGFIHGVMNTDNTAISGETIDYGPCAFMDEYHPNTVFSSIDRQGRYAFSNQPDIIVWNMAQLATALVPLMPDADDAVKEFTAAIHGMGPMLQANWLRRFAAKIGIAAPKSEDLELVTSLLTLMAHGQSDFTNTFRALSGKAAVDQFTDRDAFRAWETRWRKRLETEDDPVRVMDAANPAFIPRNHRIEEMIAAAQTGDMMPFERLMNVLSRPYDDQPENADLTRPPTENERVMATFCGT
ncbi:protein adenylyltransferase SelO [Shimia biformata]|uniref:protein adenylyltransferase SelO n=1 Tax=Shimia biformata TaxID=1294299 RepID=UPI001951A6D8|nr:YdiU family protein [Shimia biformata]